jgi:hypothetical protein
VVIEPTVPAFLSDDPEGIQALVDNEKPGDEVCPNTVRSYKVLATRLQENAHLATKEIHYKFPPGVTCNNEHYNLDEDGNPPSNPYKLETIFRVSPRIIGYLKDKKGKKKEIMSYLPFLTWRMVMDVDEQFERRTKAAKKKNPTTSLTKAFGALGVGYLGKAKPDDDENEDGTNDDDMKEDE